MDPVVLTVPRLPAEPRRPALVLSAPTEDDVPALAAACADPEIQEWTSIPSPYGVRDAELFVLDVVPAGWRDGTALTWAVRVAGEPAAMVGLVLDEHRTSAELGYWTAAGWRGRGIVTAASRAAIGHGLDALGLERIAWMAYVGNWGSRRVAWRLGFRVEGELRRHAVQRGRRRDVWFGSLLPDDPREPVGPWAGPVA